MTELYYNAYSVAYFVVSQEMGSKTQMAFLENLYEDEKEFIGFGAPLRHRRKDVGISGDRPVFYDNAAEAVICKRPGLYANETENAVEALRL